MNERLRRFAQWAFVEKWIDHAFYELVLMRLFFAAVIYDSVNWGRTFSRIVDPNGLARIEPLQDTLLWFGEAEHLEWLRSWFWLPLAIYVIGAVPIPAILSVLAVTVSVGTLENSDGGIGHSYQIVSLILLAQLGSHFYNSFGKNSETNPRPTWQRCLLADSSMQNHAVHLTKVTIAAAYVVCGVAKLIKSDFLWINKIPLLSVQITKANLRDYYNTLEEKTDFVATRIPRLVVEYPNIARLFFGCGLALELSAFLALRGRRWAFCIGLSLIVLHLMIDQIMSLTFWTHMFCLTVFYVNLPGLPKTWNERGNKPL
ncbi:MAG: hypothetical protein KDN22_22360 [Verrucomicrobiae bacterium]|nr:hypothetical protein [Verrucomicrobiae bacterium]